MNNLNILRTKISKLDAKIIFLLALRSNTTKEVGRIKRKNKRPIYDPDRWRVLLNKNVKLGLKLRLKKKFIKDIYEIIHKESIRNQKRI